MAEELLTPQGTQISEIPASPPNVVTVASPAARGVSPIQPTPEEKAAYESQFGPPPLNPIRDLSAQELADLSVQDKDNFDIVSAFRSQPDLHADPAIVQKTADALDLVEKRGFQLSDLPSPKQAAGAVVESGKGFLKQLWNYSSAANNIISAAVTSPFSTGLSEGYAQEADKALASNFAGTEEAVSGLSELGQKAVHKVRRKIGPDFTPEQKVSHLWDQVGKGEVAQQRLEGKGAFTSAVTGGTAENNIQSPEEVAQLAAGDPVSFFTFGKVAQGAGAALGAVTPGAIKGAVGAATAKAGAKLAEVVPKVGGAAISTAGKVIEVAGKAAQPIGKVASVVGPIAGAVGLATGTEPILAVGKGLIGGTAGVALRRAGEVAAEWAPKVTQFGKEVAGSAPATGAYTQLGKDFLQALPGAAGAAAKGAAIDLGLAAVTAETPQETSNAAAFGASLGLLHGAARVGGHVISGQIIGPREYGIKTVTPSSGQFKALDAVHNEAVRTAPPGVRARLNAVREFVGTRADVFLSPDSATTEKALVDSGVAPETAKLWADQKGFFTTDLTGKDGTPRRVVVMSDVEAAPHESFHVVQDVLGESANREIDKVVRDAYADRWDLEGDTYARRLVGDLGDKTWQETVLDASGWGLDEAKEKILTDISNRIRSETGAEPPAGMAEQMSKTALGNLMDIAVQNNPHLEPNEISRHVWREVLSPAEAGEVADRYIARELAAENFDAAFKTGALRSKPNSLPAKLGLIAGRVVSALGGEPLAGRTSEVGRVPLRTPVVEAVKGAAQIKAAPALLVEGKGKAVKPSPAPVAPEEGQRVAGEEAQKIADEAPGEIQAGGTRSPKELLGEVAQAISRGEGVKINYLSAPDEPAAAISSNRDTRRAMIEAFRTMPPEARALWEKTFFPDRVLRTKTGYQVLGWAPEVFAANAHKMAGFLADHARLTPYEIDPSTKSFTPDAWQELYKDTQTFVQNQKAGATGAGEPLVVPRAVTEKGFTAPAVRDTSGSLDQRKADFINLLFNIKLPETPRMTKGKLPRNIAGQDVSQATLPGRVEIPVRPRGEFTGAEAEAQGIAGRAIAEVNPLRNEIEAAAKSAGVEPPSLIEAVQRLNLENIKEVVGAPEAPEFRGNEFVLAAGFQPKEGEREWRVQGTRNGLKTEVRVNAADQAEARRKGEAEGIRIANVTTTEPVELSTGMFQPQAEKARVSSPEPTEREASSARESYNRITREPQKPINFSQEDAYPGKTFAEYQAAAEESLNQGEVSLAKEFLTLAKDASETEWNYGKKGAHPENDTLHSNIDVQRETQKSKLLELEDQIQSAERFYRDPGLAAKVWEAGGKLKEAPTPKEMDGTGYASNQELVEKNIWGEDYTEKGTPGDEKAIVFAKRAPVYGARAEPGRQFMLLAAKIADSSNPYGLIREVSKASESPSGMENALQGTIQNLERVKNEIRIREGYFGKRVPFSQLTKPKAQFSPQTEAGRALEKDGYTFEREGFRGTRQIFLKNKAGRKVGEISTSQIEDTASVGDVYVDKSLRGQGVGEALYREMLADLQADGATTLGGIAVHPGPLRIREKIFGGYKTETDIEHKDGSFAKWVNNEISPTAQFSPAAETAAKVQSMSPDEFRTWVTDDANNRGGFTKVAYDVGLGAPDQAFANQLKATYNDFQQQFRTSMKAGDLDSAQIKAMQGQFFREAYEAATGTASAGETLRKQDPNYKPPFPIQTGGLKVKPPMTERPFAEQKNTVVPKDLIAEAAQFQPEEKRRPVGGEAFAKFFHKTENTPQGGANFKSMEEILQKPVKGFEPQLEAYLKFGSNFQKHIFTSIPGFLDARIRLMKGMQEYAKAFGGSRKPVSMLDITSSEGYFTKAWAEQTQKEGIPATADALDALPAFKESFDRLPQVPGVNFKLAAWGEGFTDPNTGQEIPLFKADKKYDIVHEGMGFQFFQADRENALKEIKGMLNPDGVFITLEKFRNPDYAEREKLKDEYKARFYSKDTMAAKAKEVLNSGNDQTSVGMDAYQIDRAKYEGLLADNFKHVEQIWSSGNFAGYVASDNAKAVRGIVDTMGDTSTKFSIEKTPRDISAQFAPKKDKGYDANEFWLGKGKLNPAPAGHYAWAMENGTWKKGEVVDDVYAHTENRGFNRVVVDPGSIDVDPSKKHPTWDSLPSANRHALEDLAFERNLPVRFKGKEVVEIPRPGEPSVQFQPKGPKDKDFKLLNNKTEFTKAWILPDGTPEQIGGQWHHQWLADAPEGQAAAKKYGIKVPPFEGVEDNGSRQDALRKGFVRANLDKSTGRMTVELLASRWNKQKDAIDRLLENNLDRVDTVRVNLMNDKVDAVVDSDTRSLFDLDTDQEKLSNLPFSDREPRLTPQRESETVFMKRPEEPAEVLPSAYIGEPEFQVFDKAGKFLYAHPNYDAAQTAAKKVGGMVKVARTFKGQAQPQREEQSTMFGDTSKEYIGNAAVAALTRDELKSHFPEAIIPTPRDQTIPSDIVGSPRYKEAGDEVKAVASFADKLVEFANNYKDSPEFKSGSEWYSKFSPMLKKAFGSDAQIFAELLAATSPQTAAAVNFGYAFDALKSYQDGRFNKIVPKFEEGLAKLADNTWTRFYNTELKAGRIPKPPAEPTPAAFLEAWINRWNLKPRQSNGALYGTHSIPVLQVFARKWLTESRGPKTLNFVQNLLGTGNAATIDLWAARLLRQVGYEGYQPRWRILPGNDTGVSRADFDFGQKAFAAAGEKMGMLPDAFQGATWFGLKKHWHENGWGNLDLGDFSKELEKAPLLEKGYRQRVAGNKAKDTRSETPDLFVEPRNLKK